MKPKVKFEFLKTQSFRVLPKRLVPTKVDLAKREVKAINGRPAVRSMPPTLGCSPADVATRFMRYPLGLVEGGEPFVRSPRCVSGDSLFFYGSAVEGMGLHLLESTDILADTKAAVEGARARGPVSAIVNFQSVLRTLELERRGQTEAYGPDLRQEPLNRVLHLRRGVHRPRQPDVDHAGAEVGGRFNLTPQADQAKEPTTPLTPAFVRRRALDRLLPAPNGGDLSSHWLSPSPSLRSGQVPLPQGRGGMPKAG